MIVRMPLSILFLKNGENIMIIATFYIPLQLLNINLTNVWYLG